MKEVILPVDLNTPVISECWTHFKLSIIKTSPYYMDWLSSHLEVFMNKNMITHFGEREEAYTMIYYDDILIMNEIFFWELHPNNIIKRLTEELSYNNYILMDIFWNLNNIKNPSMEELPKHETMIYGYNTEKRVFYCSFLSKSGTFTEYQLSYENLENSFSTTYKFYKENNDYLLYQRHNHYPITSLSLRKDYNKDNSISQFISKLRKEYTGKCTIITEYGDKKETLYNYESYSGLGCLIGLENELNKCKKEDHIGADVLKNIKKSVYTLLEHRRIILNSMNWTINKIKTKDTDILILIDNYKGCVERFEVLHAIVCKFQISHDNQEKPTYYLNKIVEYLKPQYELERTTLNKYIDKLLLLYKEFLSFENNKSLYKKKTG